MSFLTKKNGFFVGEKNKTAMIPDEEKIPDGLGTRRESCPKQKFRFFCDDFGLRSPVIKKKCISDEKRYLLS